MGIEPTLEAWEAAVLPLNYTRLKGRHYSGSGDSLQSRNEQRFRPHAAGAGAYRYRPLRHDPYP